MAENVKSIDEKYLLKIGLKGFYGFTSPPEKLIVNLGEWYNTTGSDFNSNSKISAIDLPLCLLSRLMDFGSRENLMKMGGVHFQMGDLSLFEDGDRELKKPVLFTKFGLPNKNKNLDHSR